MDNPKIEPINKDLKLEKPKCENRLLSSAKKVISATAKITPGIAYPDIEKVLK